MRMCAIGDYDSICGFAALGVDIFETVEKEAVEELIKKAADKYAVVLITENAAHNAYEVIEEFKAEKIPAIIPIPSVMGDFGIGVEGLKKAVEKAVGSVGMVFGEND